MTELSGIILIVFVLYMLAMIAIGYVTSRRTQSTEQFFLADRGVKAWVTAISSTASSESAWAVLGTVGLAYKEGLSAAWFLPGCLLGYAVNWFFLADRLRMSSRENNYLTIPDYLEGRFNDKTNVLRFISVTIIFASMMAYVAAQFTAIGKTFDALFGIPYALSIPVGGGIVIFYTMMGGFLAVAWTDLVQGLLMAAGLVILSIAALYELGGLDGMVIEVNNVSPETLTLMGGKTLSIFLGSVVGLLGIGLGYPGQPHVLTRYMAAKDSSTIKKGVWIAVGWGILVYSSAILLGICGNALFPVLDDPEQLFPKAAEMLLPLIITAIVLTGVMAAIMSTVSSQILVAASAISHDIYSKIFNQNASQKKILFISRVALVVLGIGAMIVALTETRVIFWFVLFAWSGLGASFGPVILFSLYSKNVTKSGAIAGMITGFAITVIWKVSGLSDSIIYELVPAFSIASLVVWGVSKLTYPDQQEKI